MRQHLGASVAEPTISFRRLGGEDEPVVEQMEGLDFGVVDRQGDEDEVECAGHQLAHQVRGQRLAQLQAERGEAPLQLGQRRRQQVRRDRRDGAELQHPRQHPFLMLGVVHEIAHRGENGARAPGDFLALLGKLDARLAPLDQAHAELVLELLDLHAEGRLADGAGFRRMAEMPGFRQQFEIAQLPQGHHSR